MGTKSPTSLQAVLAPHRRGMLDFDKCMRIEFRIVSRFVRGHNLDEGIRAVIRDKDLVPRWRPAVLDAVSLVDVEHHFSLTAELVLP
jgi:enoyl-CoA hydratase